MKKTRIVLVGALVLALALVMGCKQNEDLSVAEHRQGASKYEHIWEATYNNNDYIRSALQFGTAKKVNAAKVKVKLYPKYGKAGLLFAVNPREVGEDDAKKTVYDFYAFAFGKKAGTNNTLEAYVDYYQGLEKFNDTGASSEKFGTSSQEELEVADFKDLDWNGSDPVTVLMNIDLKTSAGGGDSTWSLKITSEDGNKTYWEKDSISGKATSEKGDKGFKAENFKNEGALYSYGMLSGLSNPKTADTRWTVDKESLPSGTFLAAEE